MIDEDRLLRDLACLPPITPNIEREASVRKRCHAVIATRKSRIALFDIAAATALCIYLTAMFTEAMRLGGIL